MAGLQAVAAVRKSYVQSPVPATAARVLLRALPGYSVLAANSWGMLTEAVMFLIAWLCYLSLQETECGSLALGSYSRCLPVPLVARVVGALAAIDAMSVVLLVPLVALARPGPVNIAVLVAVLALQNCLWMWWATKAQDGHRAIVFLREYNPVGLLVPIALAVVLNPLVQPIQVVQTAATAALVASCFSVLAFSQQVTKFPPAPFVPRFLRARVRSFALWSSLSVAISGAFVGYVADGPSMALSLALTNAVGALLLVVLTVKVSRVARVLRILGGVILWSALLGVSDAGLGGVHAVLVIALVANIVFFVPACLAVISRTDQDVYDACAQV